MGNVCVRPEGFDSKEPQGKQMLEILDSEDSTVDTLGGLSDANKLGIWCVSSSLTRENTLESICDSSSEVGDSSQQPGCSSEQPCNTAPEVRPVGQNAPVAVPVVKASPAPEVRPVGQNAPVVNASPVTPGRPVGQNMPVVKASPAPEVRPVGQNVPVVQASPVTPILTCGGSLPQHTRAEARQNAFRPDRTPFNPTQDCCELKLDRTPFDPTEPQLKRRLLELLRIGAESSIEKLGGLRGANNSGIWFVRSSCAELIIKLVSTRLREGDKLMSLVSKYPSVAQDAGLAFPTKIVRCSVNGESLHDLIVMPKVKGEDFSIFIGEKWYSGINSGQPDGKNEVFRAMEQLGRQLKEFHVRYGGAQHGDFQPSNVFYDRNANAFTFIDLADMGPQFKADNDVQQFNRAVSNFGATYGPAFVQQSQSSFGRGYASL